MGGHSLPSREIFASGGSGFKPRPGRFSATANSVNVAAGVDTPAGSGEHETRFPLKEAPGSEDDLHRFRPGEEGQPVIHRGGHEVGCFRVQDSIAAAGHGATSVSYTGSRSFQDHIPKQELGNER